MSDESFQQIIKTLNISKVTSETVNEFELNVDEYMKEAEIKLENEMEKKRDLLNKIEFVQAQVSELWDRVDKARRRETDISYRVTAWAQHLSDQMNVVRTKKEQIGFKMNTSAALSEEIAENIQRLAEKRDSVQRMRDEIDIRRHLHKQQLKTIKNEIVEEEKEIKKWTMKTENITEAVKKLKEKKLELMEKLEKEMKKESEHKKLLENLELALKNATLQNRAKTLIDENENTKSCGRFINSFSTLTDNSDIF